MEFCCTGCGTRYSTPQEVREGRTYRYCCRFCKSEFLVREAEQAEQAGRAGADADVAIGGDGPPPARGRSAVKLREVPPPLPVHRVAVKADLEAANGPSAGAYVDLCLDGEEGPSAPPARVVPSTPPPPTSQLEDSDRVVTLRLGPLPRADDSAGGAPPDVALPDVASAAAVAPAPERWIPPPLGTPGNPDRRAERKAFGDHRVIAAVAILPTLVAVALMVWIRVAGRDAEAAAAVPAPSTTSAPEGAGSGRSVAGNVPASPPPALEAPVEGRPEEAPSAKAPSPPADPQPPAAPDAAGAARSATRTADAALPRPEEQVAPAQAIAPAPGPSAPHATMSAVAPAPMAPAQRRERSSPGEPDAQTGGEEQAPEEEGPPERTAPPVLEGTAPPDPERTTAPALEGTASPVSGRTTAPAPDGTAPPVPERVVAQASTPERDAPVVPRAGQRRPSALAPGCVERNVQLPSSMVGRVPGSVVVRFAVGRDGTADLVQAQPGPDRTPGEPVEPDLVQALEAAVRACRFSPGGDEEGRPVRMWMVVRVQFGP